MMATSLLGACTMAAGTGDDDDGGTIDGGGTDGGGGDDGGGMVEGWAQMPLLADMSHPDHVVIRDGNDAVTGIYFSSPTQGVVVTQGANGSFGNGGAVYTSSGTALTKLAFSGYDSGISEVGGVDFTGVEPTQNGYIAEAYASDAVTSTDGGQTFSIKKNGNGDAFGIEPVIGYRQTATGATMIRETGVVTVTSASAPGPTVAYTDVWAPTGNPSVPLVVPADQCQIGPTGSNVPINRSSVFVSADRQFIAYTANPDSEPQICISTDGGHSFFPKHLVVPASAEGNQPSGVLFPTAAMGITWFASSHAAQGAYIARTTDHGATWTTVALPTAIASHSFELTAGTFAPDAMTGFLAGYDFTESAALLLSTSDGGATWSTVDDVGPAVDAAHGGKLYSVFALDATHVWIGGTYGLLMRKTS